jgi:hypothetical protein
MTAEIAALARRVAANTPRLIDELLRRSRS